MEKKKTTELSLGLNFKFNLIDEYDGRHFNSLFRGLIYGPQNSFSFDLVFDRTFVENNEYGSYVRPAFYKTINRIDNNTFEICNVFGENEFFYFKNSTDEGDCFESISNNFFYVKEESNEIIYRCCDKKGNSLYYKANSNTPYRFLTYKGDDIADKVLGIRIGINGLPLAGQEKLPPGAKKQLENYGI